MNNIDMNFKPAIQNFWEFFNNFLLRTNHEYDSLLNKVTQFSENWTQEIDAIDRHLFNKVGIYEERLRDVFILNRRMFALIENINISVEGTLNILYPMLKKINDASIDQSKQTNHNIRIDYSVMKEMKALLNHFD
jgi:hypothetical protein